MSNQDVGANSTVQWLKVRNGLLWREAEVKLPNNVCSAMGQLRSLENDSLKKVYRKTIYTVVNAGYVRKVDQTEINETQDKQQWYLPHQPVINPNITEKIRRVCNAAANYQGLALNDELLSRPDLLQSLIGIFSLLRTPNGFISQHRSNISSNRYPKKTQSKRWHFTSTTLF